MSGTTWITQLESAEWAAVIGADRLVPQQRTFENEYPDPAVTPRRTSAGSGSPTTSR
jgi:hypothetical protein